MTVLLFDVEVDGRRCDVSVADGIVTSIDPVDAVPRPSGFESSGSESSGDRVIDGGGGALIPGLWDHHIHILAAAAALESVRLDADDDTEGFRDRLRGGAASLSRDSWLRVVGYHESMAGDIDRHALDSVVADRPVRVQHRSGARWILNSPGCEAAGLDTVDHEGVERAADGSATGRVTGADDWLAERTASRTVSDPVRDATTPDLRALSQTLIAAGVVGVTDAGPDSTTQRWEAIAAAVSRGEFRARVWVTGGPELVDIDPPAPLVAGPVKLYLADHSLPNFDLMCDWVAQAHRHGRAVAFHSVTRVSLAMALAALDSAGSMSGDRIEHGSVISPDAFDAMARLGVAVVTQPGFVAERGDAYLRGVDAEDITHLYRCASLQRVGIPVGGSTDAPYTDPDPWAAVSAAIQRRTRGGQTLGDTERLAPDAALSLFLTDPGSPGGLARRVEVGSPADLCLLDSPLGDVLAGPAAERVRATVIGGDVVFER